MEMVGRNTSGAILAANRWHQSWRTAVYWGEGCGHWWWCAGNYLGQQYAINTHHWWHSSAMENGNHTREPRTASQDTHNTAPESPESLRTEGSVCFPLKELIHSQRNSNQRQGWSSPDLQRPVQLCNNTLNVKIGSLIRCFPRTLLLKLTHHCLCQHPSWGTTAPLWSIGTNTVSLGCQYGTRYVSTSHLHSCSNYRELDLLLEGKNVKINFKN